MSFEERVAIVDAAALGVVEALTAHKFEEVQRRLPRGRREQSSPADLAAFWRSIEDDCGAFVRSELRTTGGRVEEFFVTLDDAQISPTSIACHFERGVIRATISVDGDGTIDLLKIHVPPNRPACGPRSGIAESGASAVE